MEKLVRTIISSHLGANSECDDVSYRFFFVPSILGEVWLNTTTTFTKELDSDNRAKFKQTLPSADRHQIRPVYPVKLQGLFTYVHPNLQYTQTVSVNQTIGEHLTHFNIDSR